MRTTTLRGGVEMPLIGFGTFQIWQQEAARKAVSQALDAGYRLIDTAAGYFNEEGVGRAIRQSSVPREQIVLTSKLWPTDASYAGAKVAVQRSLNHLGVDYIDVYLLHQALGDYYGAWRALTEMQQAGYISSIGVSNFNAGRLYDLAQFSGVVPAVNQIELNPWRQQRATRRTAAKLGTVIEAWSPFAQGRDGIFSNPVITTIAAQHHVTTAQVILRWATQQGIIVIPKSVHRQRMDANLAATNFDLTEAEIAEIAQLDRYPDDPGAVNSPQLIERLLAIDPAGKHE